MASGSSPTLADVATPIVVEIKDHPCLEFKQCSQIAKVDDSIDTLSRVSNKVLYVEDVGAYIGAGHLTLQARNFGFFSIFGLSFKL